MKVSMMKISAIKVFACVLLCTGIFSLSAKAMMGEDEGEGRPPEHFCPISQEIMRDPVSTFDGHTYERKEIEKWFETKSTSPLTGAELPHKTLAPNYGLRNLIAGWKPGKRSEPSVLETQPVERLVAGIREEFQKNEALLNAAKDKHIVAFLGNTGAGKSTLINFLAGKDLRVSDDGQEYVLANPSDPTAMAIGGTGESQTVYPQFIDIEDMRFFDLPGFNDTESERNLMNAAFIREIFLAAASVRPVFVAGQDQFTADRSTSIKQMFQALKQLFVMGEGADSQEHFINDGVFVATKMACNAQTEPTSVLLKKTGARDKEELQNQLNAWNQRGRLKCLYHPSQQAQNRGIRETILQLIKETRAAKILGINVSALYPPDTKRPLERFFLKVLDDAWNRTKKTPLHPLSELSEIDRASARLNQDGFWQMFGAEVSAGDDAIRLLKEFCTNPYNSALKKLVATREGERRFEANLLRGMKEARVKDIAERTQARAREVIATLVPQQEGDTYVTFDFGYHREIYEQVCGAGYINFLATDPQEQEIVRGEYATFISRHSHEQVLRWHERFSGVEQLKKEIGDLRNEVRRGQEEFSQRIAPLEAGALVEEEEKARLAAQEARKVGIAPRLEAAPSSEGKKKAEERPEIPLIARGYEEIYRRFFNARLIYRPTEGSDVGKIELPFAALRNLLEGAFDLSRCGDTGQHLSIATGYRKVQNPANANKIEIWFTPRFVVDAELSSIAPNHYMREVIKDGCWNAAQAPVGIFWTRGSWNAAEHMRYCDYITTDRMDSIGKDNLLRLHAMAGENNNDIGSRMLVDRAREACRAFHVSFMN